MIENIEERPSGTSSDSYVDTIPVDDNTEDKIVQKPKKKLTD